MRHARRRDRIALGRERHARLVLGDLEHAVEHVGEAEQPAELLELRAARRRHPQLRPRQGVVARLQIERAPDPRHEVAPVIEVEMRDHDRLDASASRRPLRRRPSTPGPQSSSTAPAPCDEVAGVRAARVRPGGRAAHDGQLHAGMLSSSWCSMLGICQTPRSACSSTVAALLRPQRQGARRDRDPAAGADVPGRERGRDGGPGRRRLLHRRVGNGAREPSAARTSARSAPATTSARSR